MKLADLFEELDVTIHDNLNQLQNYRRELQAELKDVDDAEIRDQIEQDIHEITDLIAAKQKRNK